MWFYSGLHAAGMFIMGFLSAYVYSILTRIMWCFFYEPERLPNSYVKWLVFRLEARPELNLCSRITSLADMDQRIITILQGIRAGTWRYGEVSTKSHRLLMDMAVDLKLNPSLGNPAVLPEFGGQHANKVWEVLDYKNRNGRGGLPCEIVHCGTAGNSCTGNALIRGVRGFGQALLIYAPVHILPALLSNPRRLLTDPVPTLTALVRSATFLSTFISSIWFTVCCVRTLFIARLFPRISHNLLDGPQGCILAGCLVCGFSIGLEKGKRRGEIALYVLPRAIRTCLPAKWVKSGSKTVLNLERLAFAWSLASLLTMAIHQPQVLRGLSRWTLGYIMEGRKSRARKGSQSRPPDEHH